jgi:hypothetical protein
MSKLVREEEINYYAIDLRSTIDHSFSFKKRKFLGAKSSTIRRTLASRSLSQINHVGEKKKEQA